MENWGLVIYKEDSLWFSDVLHPASRQLDVLLTLAHEIAHMVCWLDTIQTHLENIGTFAVIVISVFKYYNMMIHFTFVSGLEIWSHRPGGVRCGSKKDSLPISCTESYKPSTHIGML